MRALMDEIEIVEYDPRWPALFAEEAALLRAALHPDLVVGLEHFGSTAIPGLAANIASVSLLSASADLGFALVELMFFVLSIGPKW
jgi:GrpB-like predicted nucleotidyltransferase (UPF0157 family)